MSTILVTGAGGFIGKFVVHEFLNRNDHVIVVVRNKNSYQKLQKESVLEADLSNLDIEELKSSIGMEQIEACIHLAWEGIPDYSYQVSKKNLMMGMNVLELCRQLKIAHVVMSGSCWEYANPSGAVAEQAPLTVHNGFTAAKNALRSMCEAFCKENHMHYHWLRFFYVYGPGQKEKSLIPMIVKSMKEGNLPKLSGAYNRNDFIFVEDVAKAVAKTVEVNPKESILNVGTGTGTCVLDIVKKIGESLNFPVDAEEFQRNAAPASFWADQTVSKQALLWQPEYSIEQGIEEYLLWEDRNGK